MAVNTVPARKTDEWREMLPICWRKAFTCVVLPGSRVGAECSESGLAAEEFVMNARPLPFGIRPTSGMQELPVQSPFGSCLLAKPSLDVSPANQEVLRAVANLSRPSQSGRTAAGIRSAHPEASRREKLEFRD